MPPLLGGVDASPQSADIVKVCPDNAKSREASGTKELEQIAGSQLSHPGHEHHTQGPGFRSGFGPRVKDVGLAWHMLTCPNRRRSVADLKDVGVV